MFGNGTVTCSESSQYTKFNGCDGWKGTSLEECKKHCDSNNKPDGCGNNGEVCQYVVWDNNTDHQGWCQLANQECKAIETEKKTLITLKKIGKFFV